MQRASQHEPNPTAQLPRSADSGAESQMPGAMSAALLGPLRPLDRPLERSPLGPPGPMGAASAEFYAEQLKGGEASPSVLALRSPEATMEACPEQAGVSLPRLEAAIMDFYRALSSERGAVCEDVRSELQETEPVPLDEVLLRVALDAVLAAAAGPIGVMVSESVRSALIGNRLEGLADQLAAAAANPVTAAGRGLGNHALSAALRGDDRDPVNLFVESARQAAADAGYKIRRLAGFELDRLGSQSPQTVAALECALASHSDSLIERAGRMQRDALHDAWLSYLARSSYGTIRDHDDDGPSRDLLDFDQALDEDGADAIGVLHVAANVNFSTITGVPTVSVRYARMAGANSSLVTRLRQRPSLASLRVAKVVECRVAPSVTFRICRDDSAQGASRVAYPYPEDVAEWCNGPDQLLAMLSRAGRAGGSEDRFGGAEYIMGRVGEAAPREVLK